MTPAADDAAERQAQLHGCLDVCLLALLAAEPAHGYDLARRLEVAEFGTVSYGTVYPLITRLHRQGCWPTPRRQAPPAHPARSRLTEAGHDRLTAWRAQWIHFSGVVNDTLTPT